MEIIIMKKLCFIISHRPDNRYLKRINALKKYFELHIIFWNKTASEINPHIDGIEIHEITIPANQTNPLKRIPELVRFIQAAYKELQEILPDVVYVGNLDMLYIARKYKHNKKNQLKIVYEIADLHRLIVDKQKGIKRFISNILKMTERKYACDIDVLVLTSMKFFDVYYSRFLTKDRVVFLPNMPEDEIFEEYTHKNRVDEPFTIGFIGWIRYKNQLKMLIEAAGKKKCKVLFAGTDGEGPEFEEYCKMFPYVQFLGSFNYEEKIRELYDLVDCVYAVYDADWANVRIALPNKLYEAIACETPIIVSKNTYLAELVEQMGIGLSVSHKYPEDLENAIERLIKKDDVYMNMVEKCKEVRKHQNCKSYNDMFVSRLLELTGEKL